jgi:class 3 adenylate cyclase
MEVPDVGYARSGPLSIAYQVVGSGPRDVVYVRGGLDDMVMSWERPEFHELMEELTAFSRVLLYDKRGSGLSDPAVGGTALESRMDDIRAVMDAAGSEEAVLLALHEGARLAIVFAATYPERTRGLVLVDVLASGRKTADHPWGMTREEIDAEVRAIRERWGTRAYFKEAWAGVPDAPGVDPDELFEFDVARFRRGASPAAAAAFWGAANDTDVRDVLPAVRVPTTVMRMSLDPAPVRYVAERIANARYVEVPTGGSQEWFFHPPWRHAVVDEVRAAVEGEEPSEDDRVLATVLFTDIVDSTRHATAAGDRGWKDLVERHHAAVRKELARFRGTEVDTAGDGFFATFDGPARAIRCAAAIVDRVGELGLDVRAGVHTGECEVADGKVAGIAVVVGSRVSALAEPREVLVTSTVRDLVAGSGLEFEDRGEHELKGLSASWRVYRARVPR